MGTVYLARATGPLGFDKLVALKVVHPHLARERAFIHMFLDEARIASRITHANVGSVFDVGEDSGTFYLAMDYLHGESLASVLGCVARTPASRVSPLYPVIVTAIVAAACEGLHAAHELRADGEPLHVVHRDVSPHNIFVTYDGGVRVVDFGIARAAGRLHKTLSGTVRGKVAYMPPEQLRGDPLDRRADIWAIGVTLWELLTCRRLFRREAEGKTIDAVLTSFIPAASTYAPYLPPELDDIIGETLSRDPNGRPDSARALGKRLRRAIAGTGEVVGTAELAEWMEQLFADHRVDKQRMIDEARKGGVVHNVPDTERFARIPADLVPTMVEERSDVRATAAAREGMQTLRDGGMGASRAAAGGEMEAGSETQTETKTGAETGAETG
jgi:serine/threonine-protein kinase